MGALSNLDTSGFSYADFPTHLTYVQDIFRNIYGQDIYLEADSQDGQLCAAFATALYDTNQTMAQVINALSPVYVQGAQQSSAVCLNGIQRLPATASTATLTLGGAAGTIISGASAKDTNGYIWDIATCTIGSGGTVTALATCETVGAITALPNTITTINTPIFGFNSVTNASAATTGLNTESDSALRQRQLYSTAISSITVLAGLYGALLAVTNVTRAKVLENATATTDSNGLVPFSICAIVEGGATQDIINTIGLRKTMGCNTNGTTSGTYTDAYGMNTPIKFFMVAYTPIYISISMHQYAGYTSTIATEIQNSLIAYINSLAIGQTVPYGRLWTYANLLGATDSLTYSITALTLGTSASPTGVIDVPIAFNYASQITASNIAITAV